MSVSISHVVISGFTQSETLMNLHSRIEAAIDLSGKVEIVDPKNTKVTEEYDRQFSDESHFISIHSSGFALQSYGSEDIVSKNLMFLLGVVAQRIFNTTAIYNENHIC